MSDPFRRVLLVSSRVVWPVRQQVVVTLHADSRLALTRRYMALMAYSDAETAEHLSFEAYLEGLAAALVEAADRPEHLRELRRNRDLIRGLHRGMRRIDHALELAQWIIEHDGDVAAAADALLKGREMRRRDFKAREVVPYLPFAHLAMPLVARWRQLAFARRHPELAPEAIPSPPTVLVTEGELAVHGLTSTGLGVAAGLALNDRWAPAAIDAAEHWRQRYRLQLPDLVEVRARGWIGD